MYFLYEVLCQSSTTYKIMKHTDDSQPMKAVQYQVPRPLPLSVLWDAVTV